MKLTLARDHAALEAALAARQAEWRDAALARLTRWIDVQDAALFGTTPRAEQAAWAEKESAAQRLLDGIALPEEAAIIAAECALTGEAPQALAEKIVRAAQRHRTRTAGTGAVFAGARRAAAKALAAVTDPAAMEPVIDEAITTAAAALRTTLEDLE